MSVALPTPTADPPPVLVALDDPLSLLTLGVVVLCALAALAFAGGAALSLSRWRHLRQSTADQFRASLDGPIEIEGPAEPAADSDSFQAAVSDTACLVCEIEAQRYDTSGQGGGSWVTQESRTTVRPFHVDSPAGTIRVEPEGADLVLDSPIVAELDGDEPATGRTAAFLDAVGIDRSVGSVDLGIAELDTGDRYRVREGRVDVGERIYVAGTAVTNDPAVGGYGGPDAVIRDPTDRSLSERLFGHPFVIGDEGEAAVQRHFFRRGLIFAGLAVLLAVVWVAVVSAALA
jgi:hypothetical protein